MTLHYATFFEQWCSNLCHFLELPELPLPGSMAWHMTGLTQLWLYSMTRFWMIMKEDTELPTVWLSGLF